MMNYKDTELTLRLPGGGSRCYSAGVLVFGELKSSMKRGFVETVDLDNHELGGQVEVGDGQWEAASSPSTSTTTAAVKAPTAK